MRSMPVALALFCYCLLVGCTERLTPPSATGPINDNLVLVLLPYEGMLAAVDPDRRQVVRKITLGKFAADYAVAPNGKVYIPLHDDPGDRQSFVAVVNRQTGALTRIPVKLGSLDYLAITADGTAFIRTGSIPDTNPDGMLVLLADTHTDRVLGTVEFTGIVNEFTGIVNDLAPFSETETMVSVTRANGLGGNVYIIDRTMDPPRALFPADLEPWAPGRVVVGRDRRTLYGLYSGLLPADKEWWKKQHPQLEDRLLDAHIDVWDLTGPRLVRRIFLSTPSVFDLEVGPDGTLYVGHDGSATTGPVPYISVVNPETGDVRQVSTARDPHSLRAASGRLYVSSRTDKVVEIFRLPSLQKEGEVRFASSPRTPPLAR